MATIVNEQIVTGRKFRKLIDEASRLWLRISFWTKACDVEFDDGETAEIKFSNMLETINDLKQSFQNGVNKIYNYLKGLGFTPSTNSPDGICSAIQDMYDNRYNEGKEDGIAEGGLQSWSISANNGSEYTSPCIIEVQKDCRILLLTSASFSAGWETEHEEHSGASISLYKFNSKAEADAVAWNPWTGNYTYNNRYSNVNAGIDWDHNKDFTLTNNLDLSVKTGEAIVLYTSGGGIWRPRSASYRWLFY